MKLPDTIFVKVVVLLLIIFGSCPAQAVEQKPKAEKKLNTDQKPGSEQKLGAEQKPKTPQKPKTVFDYYMLLPNDYFEVPRASRIGLVDKRGGGIVDVKNGYLFAPGDGAQPSLEVALFKRQGLEDVVAVCHNESDECVGFIYFYERRDRYQGVVRLPNLLPARFDAKYTYKLPRVGKTITVTNAAGKVIHSYSWNGTKFQ